MLSIPVLISLHMRVCILKKLKCYIYFIFSTGTNHVSVMLRMSVLFWDSQINQHDRILFWEVDKNGLLPIMYVDVGYACPLLKIEYGSCKPRCLFLAHLEGNLSKLTNY